MMSSNGFRGAALARIFLAAVLLGLAACGGGSGGEQFGGGGGGGGGYTPGGNSNYTFAFEGVNESGQKVALTLIRAANSASGPTGSFDAGNSSLGFSNTDNYQGLQGQPLSGTFDTSGFSFAVTATGDKYTGLFVEEDVIKLTQIGRAHV